MLFKTAFCVFRNLDSLDSVDHFSRRSIFHKNRKIKTLCNLFVVDSLYMNFSRRVAFFFTGFIIGLLILLFFSHKN